MVCRLWLLYQFRMVMDVKILYWDVNVAPWCVAGRRLMLLGLINGPVTHTDGVSRSN